jgi:hypothetical protein
LIFKIVYIVCTGGFVYNWINKVPFIGVDEDEEVYYFHEGVKLVMEGRRLLNIYYCLCREVTSWELRAI